MTTELFREAMKNALAVGHLTQAGFDNLVRVQDALDRGEDSDEFTCVICKRDCRDVFGAASRACRADYNAD